MGGMNTPKPEKPRVVRMPNEEDPSALALTQRRREASLQRRGRLSTILTDTNTSRAGAGGDPVIGSSGQSLGK